MAFEYAYDSIDFRYAEAANKTLRARVKDGWQRADSDLQHPYLFMLWQRPVEEKPTAAPPAQTPKPPAPPAQPPAPPKPATPPAPQPPPAPAAPAPEHKEPPKE